MHFLPICYVSVKNENSNEIEITNRLKPGAIPSLFPPTTPSGACISQQEFLSSNEVVKNLDNCIKSSSNISHPKTVSLEFSQVLTHAKSFAAKNPLFTFVETKNSFFLFIQEKVKPFRNLFSISVNSAKSVEFFSNGKELERKLFESFFSKKYFVTSLLDFDRLLQFISLNHLKFLPSPSNPIESLRETHDCNDLIDFFEEQLLISKMAPNKRKYSHGLIIFCFIILCRSRSTFLKMAEYFFLPNERTLRRYSSGIGKSLKTNEHNFLYFKQQCEALLPHERDVSLKHDEIQIKSKVEFRGGELFGYAENREGEIATHLQCFMIRSMKSKYMEMVNLVPVFKQDATFLKQLLLDQVDFVERAGYRVSVVTSDNAPINGHVTKTLTDNYSRSYFFSENLPDHKIFMLFDPPHFMKSLRNCWHGLSNDGKTFEFPPFLHESFGTKASFKKIEDLYNEEYQNCVRLGFKLNYSAINPTSIEKQKVHLALRIFDEKTSAAVKAIFPEETGLFNFLRHFDKVWKCFNINNTTKGENKLDLDSEPFEKATDSRITFLRQTADWLDEWRKMKKNPGKISGQTFTSISFSCRSMADIIEHLLITESYDYVLTYTFQSDCIEGMFGIFRQSNGGSFHLSHDEVLASAKKIRVATSLSLHGKLLDLADEDVDELAEGARLEVGHIYNDLEIDFADFAIYDENIREPSVYIGGYIVRKLASKSDCNDCLLPFFSLESGDRPELIDSVYFETINRGGLTLPSPKMVEIIMKCIRFFELYLQKKIVHLSLRLCDIIKLFHHLLNDLGDDEDILTCSAHPGGNFKNLHSSLVILSKILLKNFAAARNDEKKAGRTQLAKKARYDSETQIEKFYM